MNIDLTECLVVLSRTVASERVHLVPHRHRSMVDSPGPPFKVHRPAQHPTREHLRHSQSLDHHWGISQPREPHQASALITCENKGNSLLRGQWRGGDWEERERRAQKGEQFILLC